MKILEFELWMKLEVLVSSIIEFMWPMFLNLKSSTLSAIDHTIKSPSLEPEYVYFSFFVISTELMYALCPLIFVSIGVSSNSQIFTLRSQLAEAKYLSLFESDIFLTGPEWALINLTCFINNKSQILIVLS